MTPTNSSHRQLALVGDVDGARRTYLLRGGLNRVGRGHSGEVVLAFDGISRRHALVVVEPHRLVLEDLGSKNGTFANGERIESHRLAVGDRLRFGPVALQLEELLDAGAGIAARGLDRLAVSRDSDAPPTTLAFAGELPALWESSLAWFESLLAPEPIEFLERVTERLGARGAAWLTREGDGPLLVEACFGVPPAESLLVEALALSTAPLSARSSGDVRAVEVGDVHGRRRSFAIWGASMSRARLEPLLRFLLRFAPRTANEVHDSPASNGSPRSAAAAKKLAIPAGWIPGDSPPMRALLRQIQAIAASELPILILGETGVGKEGVARILHDSSPRARAPFVAANCAAIPRDLLEAELFGVGRGVATGVSQRPGKVLAANGGTVFLDEIGELPLELQAKLLRFLQEREIQPLGSAPVAVDVRVLAATNVHLDERVRDGSFRADLYYRLAGYALRVPPLRERKEDIPALVEHYLGVAARAAGRSIAGLTVGALEKLVAFSWPGNVRELAHEVQKLVWFAVDSEVIGADRISFGTHGGTDASPSNSASTASSPPNQESRSTLAVLTDSDLDLEALERAAIVEALRRARGNQSRAADILGITRTALYRRIQRFGLAAEIG